MLRTSSVSSQSDMRRSSPSMAWYTSLRDVQSVTESLRNREASNSGIWEASINNAIDECGIRS